MAIEVKVSGLRENSRMPENICNFQIEKYKL